MSTVSEVPSLTQMDSDLRVQELLTRFQSVDLIERNNLTENDIRFGYRMVSIRPEFEALFHEVSIELQFTLMLWINNADQRIRLETAFTVIRLMHQSGYDRSILSRWAPVDYGARLAAYDGPGGRPSYALIKKVCTFTDERRRRDRPFPERHDRYSLYPVFFFLMRTIHGEDAVMKMLDYWTDNIGFFTVPRFEKIAGIWDDAKHLPVQWGLSIA